MAVAPAAGGRFSRMVLADADHNACNVKYKRWDRTALTVARWRVARVLVPPSGVALPATAVDS